jgi:hypothetical protein
MSETQVILPDPDELDAQRQIDQGVSNAHVAYGRNLPPQEGSLRDIDHRPPEESITEISNPELQELALRGLRASRDRIAREQEHEVPEDSQQKLF